MTTRKTFLIKDLNKEKLDELQRVVKENGNTIHHGDIINLAIELFFRHQSNDDDYSYLVKIMRQEHLF